jgi:hypothetical protein
MGYAREIFLYGFGDIMSCALCYDVLKDAQQCTFGHRRAAVARARDCCVSELRTPSAASAKAVS